MELLILPGAVIMTRLQENLVPLENHEYNLKEMFSVACDIANTVRPGGKEVFYMVNSIYRVFVSPSDNENDDAEIMRRGVLMLVQDLVGLFDAFGLYREDAHSFQFHEFCGDDFVLRKERHANGHYLAPPTKGGAT